MYDVSSLRLALKLTLTYMGFFSWVSGYGWDFCQGVKGFDHGVENLLSL